MLEILEIIALLCQLGSGANIQLVQDSQLRCQKEFIKCIDSKDKKGAAWFIEGKLKTCILEKKPSKGNAGR